MITLKQLSDLHLAAQRIATPSVPEHALVRKTFSDKSANSLAKALVYLVEHLGGMAWRQNSTGMYRQGETVIDVIGRTRIMKGMWTPGTTKGIGDVMSILNGRSVAWEIKVGKDRPSAFQKMWQAKMQAAGGEYLFITCWDDVWSKGGHLLVLKKKRK